MGRPLWLSSRLIQPVDRSICRTDATGDAPPPHIQLDAPKHARGSDAAEEQDATVCTAAEEQNRGEEDVPLRNPFLQASFQAF